MVEYKRKTVLVVNMHKKTVEIDYRDRIQIDMTETEIGTITEAEIETVIGITTGGMIEVMTEKEAMIEDMTGTGVTTGETVTTETGKGCILVLLLIGEADVSW